MQRLKVNNTHCDIRLDKFVSNEIELSRSLAAKMISSGDILVNGENKKASYLVQENDEITIEIPKSKPTDIVPQDIPINIVFEDKHIIVINKQRNIVVHPSPGHEDMTLVNGLLFHCKDIKGIGSELRPGIVHRIDKNTTGLLVIAKTDKAMQSLSKQIGEKTAVRKYKALVEGVVKEDGCIETNIGRSHTDRKKQAVVMDGRFSRTHYFVEKTFTNHSLLDVKLDTGRTHQIRVHLAHIRHPVVGDELYGYKRQKFNLKGQLLHAYSLEFVHPDTGEIVCFSAPLPDDFTHIVNILDKKANK